MSEKTNSIIYWVTTGLMCLIFLYSAGLYFFKYEMVKSAFTALGFPTWVIYPLAVAKILGVIAVISNQSKLLKEWAYAGFFFDALFAFFAHIMVDDGQESTAMVVILLLVASRFFNGKLENKD